MTDIEELKQGASRVKNETKEGGNTAERIGSLFEKTAQILETTQMTGTIEEFTTSFEKKAGETFKNS